MRAPSRAGSGQAMRSIQQDKLPINAGCRSLKSHFRPQKWRCKKMRLTKLALGRRFSNLPVPSAERVERRAGSGQAMRSIQQDKLPINAGCESLKNHFRPQKWGCKETASHEVGTRPAIQYSSGLSPSNRAVFSPLPQTLCFPPRYSPTTCHLSHSFVF